MTVDKLLVWMRLVFGLGALLYGGFAALVLITQLPMSEIWSFGRYRRMPEDCFGPLHGWTLDLALCLGVSLSGFFAWLILRTYTHHSSRGANAQKPASSDKDGAVSG